MNDYRIPPDSGRSGDGRHFPPQDPSRRGDDPRAGRHAPYDGETRAMRRGAADGAPPYGPYRQVPQGDETGRASRRQARRSDAWSQLGGDPRHGAGDAGDLRRRGARYGGEQAGYYPGASYGEEPMGAPYQPGHAAPYEPAYQPRAYEAYDERPYRRGPADGAPPVPPRGPRHGGGGAGGPGDGRGGGRPPRRGGIVAGRIIATIVSVVLVAVSGIAWAAVGGAPHNASDATDQAGSVGVSSAVTTTTDAKGNVITVPVSTQGMNILVVGSDSRTDAEGNPLSPAELKLVSTQLDGGGVSTDTLMIVHVPGNGKRATAISIPRDTWMTDAVVQAPGVVGPYSDGTEGQYKPNKINSFYGSAMTYEREYLVSKGVTNAVELNNRSAEAGRTMLIKVVQQFTGIKIDHYAEVNLIGFYLLSKAIGGVPVCLVKAVKDRQSGADFPAGHFEVSGASAMSFVRQRHGLPQEDLDRIRRQQAFLASAADKILSVDTLTSPSKLKALIDAADRSLVLDKGFNLLSFAQQMMNLTSGNITFATIPTHGNETVDGKSAVVANDAEVRGFFANLMTDRTESTAKTAVPTSVNPAATTVDVQNGTETPGMAAQVGTVVAAAGFQRGQLSDYPGVTADNQQAKTTIRYPAGGEAAATAIAKALKHGSPVADDSVPAGHVLVVVGTDMPAIPASALPTVPPAAPTTPTSVASSNLSTTLPKDAINASSVPCIN